jgi:hypothetical protein
MRIANDRFVKNRHRKRLNITIKVDFKTIDLSDGHEHFNYSDRRVDALAASALPHSKGRPRPLPPIGTPRKHLVSWTMEILAVKSFGFSLFPAGNRSLLADTQKSTWDKCIPIRMRRTF